MNRVAVIVYHSNASEVYAQEWIEMCMRSIRGQTFADFDVVELAYDGVGPQYYMGSKFSIIKLDSYADAMNHLLDYCFWDNDYEVVFNTNIDDTYVLHRFERQLARVFNGAQLVSSDYKFIDESGRVVDSAVVSHVDIAVELAARRNPMCHPVIAYTREFWRGCSRYWPQQVPQEDLELWRREVGNYRFEIIPEVLAYYRIHRNNSGHLENPLLELD